MDETSECCRESPRLPLTSVEEDFQFRDEELTGAGLKGTGECLSRLHISPSLNDPNCRCFQACHADNRLNEEIPQAPRL